MINVLSCTVLSIDQSFLSEFRKIENGFFTDINPDVLKVLINNKFVYESMDEEKDLISNAYKKYLMIQDNMPLTNFIFLTYDCNLRCSYCCYRYLNRLTPVMNKDYLDNLFGTMKSIQDRKKKKNIKIVLSGGEPFLIENQNSLEYYFKKLDEFIKEERDKGCKITSSIFTNATNIVVFENFIKDRKNLIDLVYVTLNGTKDIHDKDRKKKNGIEGSYDDTIAGVNKLLELRIPTWIVANVSNETIYKLPMLSQLVKEKGWKEDKCFGGIYISRIKDHKKKDKKAISELDMIQIIIKMVRENKINITDFNFGDLRLLKVMIDFVQNSKLSDIERQYSYQFSGCNNRSNQYSFSVDGKIYPCAPSMGISEYATGEFFPKIDISKLDQCNWLDQSLNNIPKCNSCKVVFLCGGGCAFEAIEKNKDVKDRICVNADKILEIFLDAMDENIKIIHNDVLYK
ncbi:MAG: SPASM domain-containing protein [Bacteroidales bacterium]|nr:SPASM domain-containing protein [Bacteroidales bacterium]